VVVDPIANAYDSLAAVYDDLTHDHDYDAWTATLEQLASRHGLRGRRLLDLACGTGKSFLPFAARGFAVTACDISRGMLAQAGRKAGPDVRLLEADMRRLPALGAFDLVTCLDDALNYLEDERELTDAFHGAARSLAPNGVFLFDLNTLGIYRSLFAGESCSELEDAFFVWRGGADRALPEGAPAPLTIEAFRRRQDGSWTRVTSHHSQRHFSDGSVRRALEQAGLHCVAVHGLTPDGVLHADVQELVHTKRVYVARPRREEVTDAPHQEAGEADHAGAGDHQVQLSGGRATPAVAPSGCDATRR
jgi:SAM-dependent methyltransferase